MPAMVSTVGGATHIVCACVDYDAHLTLWKKGFMGIGDVHASNDTRDVVVPTLTEGYLSFNVYEQGDGYGTSVKDIEPFRQGCCCGPNLWITNSRTCPHG